MSQATETDQLNVERVKILYSNAGFTLIGILLAYCAIAIILGDNLSRQSLFLWSFLIALTIVLRLILVLLFKRGYHFLDITPDNATRSEWIFAITCYPQALAFVSLVFFPFEQDQLISALFLGLTLLLLMAGSIVSSGTSKLTSVGFISSASIPFIIYCVVQGSDYYYALGFFYSASFIVLSRLAIKLNDTICGTLRLQIENQLASLKDPLTDLWNRRRLDLFASQTIPLLDRMGGELSIILLDIDNFKMINDTEGHDRGDRILISISDYLKNHSRESDLVIRYGGEEFLVVMPATSLDYSEAIAKRINNEIREHCGVTVSIGVSSYHARMGIDRLIKNADKALYQAKRSGKDQVIISS